MRGCPGSRVRRVPVNQMMKLMGCAAAAFFALSVPAMAADGGMGGFHFGSAIGAAVTIDRKSVV